MKCSSCGRELTAYEEVEAIMFDITECECGGGLVEI
jgi:hypothetical protein